MVVICVNDGSRWTCLANMCGYLKDKLFETWCAVKIISQANKNLCENTQNNTVTDVTISRHTQVNKYVVFISATIYIKLDTVELTY